MSPSEDGIQLRNATEDTLEVILICLRVPGVEERFGPVQEVIHQRRSGLSRRAGTQDDCRLDVASQGRGVYPRVEGARGSDRALLSPYATGSVLGTGIGPRSLIENVSFSMFALTRRLITHASPPIASRRGGGGDRLFLLHPARKVVERRGPTSNYSSAELDSSALFELSDELGGAGAGAGTGVEVRRRAWRAYSCSWVSDSRHSTNGFEVSESGGFRGGGSGVGCSSSQAFR